MTSTHMTVSGELYSISSLQIDTMIRPDVTPDSPLAEQPTIGLIGMGAMGNMYAKYLSEAGWKKCVSAVRIITKLG